MARNDLIDVRGLEKTFRSKFLRRPMQALNGLSLNVREGEIYGFLGPNGAGKTTTIKILLGLIRPSAGSGTVLGRPFGSVEVRRGVGYLPDSPNFYRSLTAVEVLRFTGSLHGMERRELAGRTDEILDRVQLPEEARHRPLRTYSRGMLQRIGIAAAVLHRPRLVLFDEPMNGLDPLGRHEFRDLILSLKKEGVTVFLSSHVLADIEATADRVGIVSQGRLVQNGLLEDLLSDDGRGIEIGFHLDDTRVLHEIRELMEDFRPGPKGWLGRVSGTDVGAHIVRRVLDGGGELLDYQRHRVSLEDFFVRQVVGLQDDEAKSIRAAAGSGASILAPRVESREVES